MVLGNTELEMAEQGVVSTTLLVSMAGEGRLGF